MLNPTVPNRPTEGTVHRLSLRPAGMFSNVNEVVEQLRLAEEGNYRFAIDWSASSYLDPGRLGDPWGYFFEPPFPNVRGSRQDDAGVQELPGGKRVACTQANVITPRLEDGKCDPLLLPRDRLRAHDIIVRHLNVKPHLLDLISQFRTSHFRKQMIGLHMRGPGRVDGGVVELRRRFGSGTSTPVEAFFRQVDAVLQLLPDAGIFACSDSSAVIDSVLDRYADRVVTWPAIRSVFGEMHAKHPENEGLSLSPYQLGVDVVSEAYLLASTDVFVHGNSNVANFVVCLSPHLLHAYVQA